MAKACLNGHADPPRAKNYNCLVCAKEYKAKWYMDRREQDLAKKKERYQKNKEQIKAQARENWRKKNNIQKPTRPMPDMCELCSGPPNGMGSLHLDHCHKTGKFRGWLCHNCNTGLGKLGDNEAGLLKAIDYLKRSLT